MNSLTLAALGRSPTFKLVARPLHYFYGVAPPELWTVSGTLPTNAVKFHPGHYVWFDNVDWGTVAAPHTQQTNFRNFLAGSYGQNNNIAGVEIYLDYGNLDQGASSPDYSNGESIFNDILSRLATANLTRTRQLRVMFVLSMAVTQAANNTNAWPPWWVSSGYTVNTTSGWTGSIVDLRNSAAVTAVNNLLAHFGALYDSSNLVEMISFCDETDLLGFGPINSSSVVQGNYQAIWDAAVTAFPTTLVRVNANFANSTPNNEDAFFTNFLIHARTSNPGHLAWGGPDPGAPGIFTYNIDGELVFQNACGASGCTIPNYTSSAGDLRGIIPFVGHVEENGLVTFAQSGNQANPVTGGPSALLNYWLNTDHAWHVVWNFQVNYGYWGWDAGNTGGGGTTNTQYAAIASVSGATLNGVPSEGTWNTSGDSPPLTLPLATSGTSLFTYLGSFLLDSNFNYGGQGIAIGGSSSTDTGYLYATGIQAQKNAYLGKVKIPTVAQITAGGVTATTVIAPVQIPGNFGTVSSGNIGPVVTGVMEYNGKVYVTCGLYYDATNSAVMTVGSTSLTGWTTPSPISGDNGDAQRLFADPLMVIPSIWRPYLTLQNGAAAPAAIVSCAGGISRYSAQCAGMGLTTFDPAAVSSGSSFPGKEYMQYPYNVGSTYEGLYGNAPYTQANWPAATGTPPTGNQADNYSCPYTGHHGGAIIPTGTRTLLFIHIHVYGPGRNPFSGANTCDTGSSEYWDATISPDTIPYRRVQCSAFDLAAIINNKNAHGAVNAVKPYAFWEFPNWYNTVGSCPGMFGQGIGKQWWGYDPNQKLLYAAMKGFGNAPQVWVWRVNAT